MRLFQKSTEYNANKQIDNRVEQKQLSLEQDQRNKRYKSIDISENEVVFKSFEKKNEYERKENL